MTEKQCFYKAQAYRLRGKGCSSPILETVECYLYQQNNDRIKANEDQLEDSLQWL